jgi:hypothetical protein
MNNKVYIITSEGGALYQVESVWTTYEAAAVELEAIRLKNHRYIPTRGRYLDIVECEVQA